MSRRSKSRYIGASQRRRAIYAGSRYGRRGFGHGRS